MSNMKGGCVAGAPVQEAEGWECLGGERFNETAGPFQHRYARDGAALCRMVPEERHTNGLGIVHGGALLTLADYCLFISARPAAEGAEIVTVSLSTEFLGAAWPGDRLEARGEVLKAGRSLIFVRGMVSVGSRPLLSFSGVAKIVPTSLSTSPERRP